MISSLPYLILDKDAGSMAECQHPYPKLNLLSIGFHLL